MKRAETWVRSILTALVSVAAILVVTQFVLPGSSGPGRGTPPAVLFRGVVLGSLGALTAGGLVLIYRSIRVINFAQVALGIPGGVLAINLILFTPVPFPLAFLAGVALAALTGFATGVLALRFTRAPRLVLTVLAILLAPTLAFIGNRVDALGIFPPVEQRPLFNLDFGGLRGELPFPGFAFQIGSFPVKFGYAEIFALQAGLLVLLGAGAFLRYSRTGVAVRAMAQNADRAELLGIGVGALSIVTWVITATLSGVGVILAGVITTPQDATSGFGAELLLPALAAAVIGKMRNLPLTALAAIAIGVFSQAWLWSFPNDTDLFSVALFLIVGGGLVWGRWKKARSEQLSETSSWAATQEQRPIPSALRSIPGIRYSRLGLMVIGLAAVGIYPFAVGSGATNIGGVIALNAIAVLSLVVLTGWAGQVSLGQYGFVAIGAVLGGALTGRFEVPFLLAILLTTLFVAGFAALVGLPALRIPGLFLLVVTFAFAAAIQAVLFNERYFGWLLPEAVDRPSFFFLDFEDERSMYFLCVGALVLSIGLVVGLRKSRIGRNLIGVRDNESGIRSLGVAAVKTKLLAFAISGGLAGFAGALFAHQQRGVSAESFVADASLQVFIQAVFGGVGSVSGALLGSAYFNFVSYFATDPVWRAIFGPILTLGLLYAAPAGLISLVNTARDSVLRIVAHRKGILVPSLLADYDPDLAVRNLTALAAPLPGAGLAALPARRFVMESRYRLTGVESDGEGTRIRDEEAAVIGAAVKDSDEESQGTS